MAADSAGDSMITLSVTIRSWNAAGGRRVATRSSVDQAIRPVSSVAIRPL